MIAPDADFERIILENRVLIDVRAPAEYSAGAVPQAVNLPLMNDQERRQVGLCYKQQGQAAAVALGRRLVQGHKKAERVQAWADCLERHPEALFYCARGGLRSEITLEWLRQEAALTASRIAGGYKAFRNFLLRRLEPELLSSRPVILGGRTGTGKTLLLRKLDNAIDLEDIARHRGSSFGRFTVPQPGQADFENRLACALIRHAHRGCACLVIEDEGKHVGKRYLPHALAQFFASGVLVQLEAPLSERVQITYEEYVLGGQAEFVRAYGESCGLDRWHEEMARSAERIGKRLGSERLARVKRLQVAAHHKQSSGGTPEGHKEWIELLLRDYYDPMYDYQLQKKSRSIVFRGDAAEVLSYLQALG